VRDVCLRQVNADGITSFCPHWQAARGGV